MEEKINYIHELIKEIYPEAVRVDILVNSSGIEVYPQYRTNIDGYGMQTITGQWVKGTKYKVV